MDELTKNDIVQLETDSPKMTVSGVDTNGYVFCSWINRLGAEMRGSFPIHLLKNE
ncbi:uncharacterized protein YodC (DUF2158 family) [Aquimarina sp. EL_43]|uniref:DUF2158 domain-containing protein n=1 Tax=Aquimarina TaxID=290174 RepID=UPI0004BCEE6C|nr:MULTISPECIES: DUF2158 domain-containing protein [Aquimarina]MBG6130827.1 uncharacterized protein YodC (DUF2158 family) [Aquimarina sp. EL_35]MBG6151026.1 uncharacterized protein YodC (DUF2158 family) [Aquimarina sp. EL_32]MBG6169217.1 uncharacterized protein YodC (DUF2158 family) [Aquimarina sp. EL_43]